MSFVRTYYYYYYTVVDATYFGQVIDESQNLPPPPPLPLPPVSAGHARWVLGSRSFLSPITNLISTFPYTQNASRIRLDDNK